jgi:hypothetical protein
VDCAACKVAALNERMEQQMPDTPPSDYRAEQAEAGRSAADARIEDLTKAAMVLLHALTELTSAAEAAGWDGDKYDAAFLNAARDAIADTRAVVAGKGH